MKVLPPVGAMYGICDDVPKVECVIVPGVDTVGIVVAAPVTVGTGAVAPLYSCDGAIVGV